MANGPLIYTAINVCIARHDGSTGIRVVTATGEVLELDLSSEGKDSALFQPLCGVPWSYDG